MKFATDDANGKVRKVLSAVIDKTVGAQTIGTLPKGATIKKVTAGIRTGFDGTSATIDVGHSGDTDAYMDNTDITEATAGVYTFLPSVAALAADTTVIATIGGTVGTTGDATIEIEYEV